MGSVVYEIDGRSFVDFAGFIEEFNRVFVRQFDSTWNGNLDAFNDYLFWPDQHPYLLVWRHSDLSRQRLGHEEMAKWLEERVRHCHLLNVPEIQRRLGAACRVEGETMFDLLVEIIRDNAECVTLRLE